jgi:hypothetical protein
MQLVSATAIEVIIYNNKIVIIIINKVTVIDEMGPAYKGQDI